MNKKRKIMIASILVLSVALLTCIAVIGNRKKVISTDRSAQFDNPQINAWCKKMFERHEWRAISEQEVEIKVNEDDSGEKKEYPYFYYKELAYEPKNIIVKKEFLGKSLDVQQCNVEESGYQIQEIREIKGNSALYQMAVKWRDDEQYYIYYNYEYEPKDMKQYLQDLGMENYSVVARLYLDVDKENSDIKLTDHTLIYTNGVEEMLKKYVFSKSGKYMCESNDSCNLRIEMYIQELGMYIYVDFTRDNHIRIKDVETTKNYKFQFGEENLKTLQTCIENEMTGYLVESEAEEDIDNEETIMPTVLPLE